MVFDGLIHADRRAVHKAATEVTEVVSANAARMNTADATAHVISDQASVGVAATKLTTYVLSNEAAAQVTAAQLATDVIPAKATHKEALAAAKARGVKLGGFRAGAKATAQMRRHSIEVRSAAAEERARDLAPIIAELRAQGAQSLRDIAAALTDRGIPTARGGTEWTAAAVARVLQRNNA
jgi:hypothetical protein